MIAVIRPREATNDRVRGQLDRYTLVVEKAVRDD